MELRHLRYFEAVARAGSYTRAAELLHVAQSALSASVLALERELGVALFDRSARRIRLTDAGVAMLAGTRRVDAALDGALDEVAAAAGALRGTVRIGVMHNLLPAPVLAALADFNRHRPQVRLALTTSPDGSAGLLTAVLDGDVDVAVASLPGDHVPGVTAVRLSREAMVLICAPGHPLAARTSVTARDVRGEVWVDVPRGWGSRASAETTFAAAGVQRRVDVEIGDVGSVVDLVRAGLGVAVVAPSSARSLAGVTCVELVPAPQFEVHLVTAQARPSGAAARAFVASVLNLSGLAG